MSPEPPSSSSPLPPPSAALRARLDALRPVRTRRPRLELFGVAVGSLAALAALLVRLPPARRRRLDDGDARLGAVRARLRHRAVVGAGAAARSGAADASARRRARDAGLARHGRRARLRRPRSGARPRVHGERARLPPRRHDDRASRRRCCASCSCAARSTPAAGASGSSSAAPPARSAPCASSCTAPTRTLLHVLVAHGGAALIPVAIFALVTRR